MAAEDAQLGVDIAPDGVIPPGREIERIGRDSGTRIAQLLAELPDSAQLFGQDEPAAHANQQLVDAMRRALPQALGAMSRAGAAAATGAQTTRAVDESHAADTRPSRE